MVEEGGFQAPQIELFGLKTLFAGDVRPQNCDFSLFQALFQAPKLGFSFWPVTSPKWVLFGLLPGPVQFRISGAYGP